ncbi:glycosyltransferase [Nesterenkonia haasae]|uniref:glycosyltransferase n=1 Tax=Nesterenkonia haasae TaxID=2587813 RepID=UPI001391D16A|nr:glycosyltransferase [Nesterenkonia haasae]NDK33178.1 hypothetical protein [Nesterenkonia haasae]
MKFVGHTRFSVYSYQSDKFAATRGKTDENAYREWLYAPERLEPRTEIFLEETLPQIERAQKGKHDVVHVVCYSPTLPERYKAALQDAERTFDFVRLHEVDEPVSGFAPPAEAIRQSVQWSLGSSQRLGIYRLDDDDLLAEDYFDRMAKYSEVAGPGWRVSLGYGYSAIRSEGKYYFARRDYHPMVSVGMLSIVDLAPDGSIEGLHDTAHQRSDTGGPVILESSEVAFFRSRHPGQDNILAKFKGQDFLSSAVAEMRRWSPISVQDIGHQFPVLEGRIDEEIAPRDGAVELLTEPIQLKEEAVRFDSPHRRGCLLSLEIEGKYNRDEMWVAYKLRSTNGAQIDDADTKARFSANLIKHSTKHGYYESLPANERGPRRHLVVRCPEGVELTDFEIVSKKKKKVTLKSVRVYPLLSSETSHP